MIKSPAVSNNPQELQGRKIILGLSGGVDSAVAAMLLQQRGAEVHALHMTNWEDDDGYCTAAADLQDARQICEQLEIPLHHVNFAEQYRQRVFAYFLAEYRSGRTPNPDVLCNREIKFGVFRDYAKRLGGELLATGHYARTVTHNDQPQLLKALDLAKDQSYFLHAVSAAALAETVFPLGDLQKDQVRAIARDSALAVHDKKDSTGICFIGERPFRDFLASYLPANPGPMLTPDGVRVGEHHGLMYYTLGQRQGLGIGGVRGAADKPWYVAAKNLQDNTLLVVQADHPMLYSEAVEVADATWIGSAPAELSAGEARQSSVKLRYRHADQGCTLSTLDADRLLVQFDEPQVAATPGQFAVFYDGDRCLGGGVIDRVIGAENTLRRTG
jgi:tRNA-specific 2-thiouridylase